jgi:hypothetical protein
MKLDLHHTEVKKKDKALAMNTSEASTFTKLPVFACLESLHPNLPFA